MNPFRATLSRSSNVRCGCPIGRPYAKGKANLSWIPVVALTLSSLYGCGQRNTITSRTEKLHHLDSLFNSDAAAFGELSRKLADDAKEHVSAFGAIANPDSDVKARTWALYILGETHDARAFGQLTPALKWNDPEIVHSALLALRELDRSSALTIDQHQLFAQHIGRILETGPRSLALPALDLAKQIDPDVSISAIGTIYSNSEAGSRLEGKSVELLRKRTGKEAVRFVEAELRRLRAKVLGLESVRNEMLGHN